LGELLSIRPWRHAAPSTSSHHTEASDPTIGSHNLNYQTNNMPLSMRPTLQMSERRYGTTSRP
jgi:hypothetical protein